MKAKQFIDKYKNHVNFILFFIGISSVTAIYSAFESNRATVTIAFVLGIFFGIFIVLMVFYMISIINYHYVFKKIFKYKLLKYKMLYWLYCLALGVIINKALVLFDSSYSTAFGAVFIINVFTFLIDYINEQQLKKQLLLEKHEAELIALKAQVNPHFLFNTLNTIYNEASREGNEQSAEMIQQLSSIMRFTLQESQNQFTSIEKEIAFIEKYVALQKARLPRKDDLQVVFLIDWDGFAANIAPLMLIPFIENAFKYAISFDKPSFIDGLLEVNDGQLEFKLKNSISPNAHLQKGANSGIENITKRLKMIYPDRHTLMIESNENIFNVHLRITLNTL